MLPSFFPPTRSQINFPGRFYKLLIYRPGDYFHAHVDSQYSIDQFATLTVHLPSSYTGGRLIVGSRIDTLNPPIVFDYNTVIKPPSTLPYTVWLSNVVHEVEEVTEGYRVVLVYHLHREGVLLPATFSTDTNYTLPLLRQMMTTRFPGYIQPRGLVIVLKHGYSYAVMKECIQATRPSSMINQSDPDRQIDQLQSPQVDRTAAVPLLRGRDAVIYQIVKMLRVPFAFRFMIDQIYVQGYGPISRIVGPYQKDCAWLAFNPTGSKRSLHKPNLLSPHVLCLDARRGTWANTFAPETYGQWLCQHEIDYGNADCGEGWISPPLSAKMNFQSLITSLLEFYYRETCLVVDMFSIWARRRLPILLSYVEETIFHSLRSELPELLQLVVLFFDSP